MPPLTPTNPPEPTPTAKAVDWLAILKPAINAALIALAAYVGIRFGIPVSPPQLQSQATTPPVVIVFGGSGAPSPSVLGGK